MRIGILTFHYSANFGANLQTLATFSYLKEMGHSPIVLDYRSPKKTINISELLTPEQAQEHDKFIKTYLTVSPAFDTEKTLAEYIRKECDAVVVGSDAVFRLGQGLNPKRLINQMLGRGQKFWGFADNTEVPPYFLNWNRDGDLPVKASLAPSSRMTKHWFLKRSVVRQIGHSLQDFDIISTRDQWTANLVGAVTKKRKAAEVCPDPLFMLNRHFPLPSLSPERGDLRKKVLLTGNYPQEWVDALQATLKKRGLGLVSLPNPGKQFNYKGIDDNLTLPMSPTDWYQAIASSAGYIGPRIHAIIAAIATKTPFICEDPLKPMFSDKARYDAYYDLLERAGGTERYFLHRDLIKQDAEKLYSLLFDSSGTQISCDAYAETAANQVEDLLSRVIDLTQKRLTRAAA